ncbi:MAG: hypothetical protein MUC78_08915 [Bacteroidales bacterium]|jgi:lipoate-protein ligase A|nr:hypothetical protein [Bacteroidales bacterium]
MAVTVMPYSLPDAGLFAGKGDGLLIWQPESTVIVLGQSNTPEKSLILPEVERDNIPVTKRPTGGEAVILTPAMAVITVAMKFSTIFPSKEFFGEINGVIIRILSDLGVNNLGLKGISDITIGHKKILGSSMHRRENRLVYHAVLNTGEDPDIFEKYLRHPSREPEYRQNRKHGEFVTSLEREGFQIEFGDLVSKLKSRLTED